ATEEATTPQQLESPQSSGTAKGILSRGFRQKQPVRRKVERQSPPPSEPPTHSQNDEPSQETLAGPSADTRKKCRFMKTPGLHN
ncbi:hypothetical protein PIB30_108274, partial [Stylosanthes scabra]|nr:hypothetical protein [Stylosanthes scabra]